MFNFTNKFTKSLFIIKTKSSLSTSFLCSSSFPKFWKQNSMHFGRKRWKTEPSYPHEFSTFLKYPMSLRPWINHITWPNPLKTWIKNIFILLCCASQIFKKVFYKLKKLSYMNELMYNLVTWSDWSMALNAMRIKNFGDPKYWICIFCDLAHFPSLLATDWLAEWLAK